MKTKLQNDILARKLIPNMKGTAQMARLRIKEVAEKRGIKTAYQLQKLLDTYPSDAYRLWDGKLTMISLHTLQKLCNKLKCTPNQLIEIDAE